MEIMNIAISGFNNDPNLIELLEKNGYNIHNVITKDVKFLLTKEDPDFIRYKSAKLKHAITFNIPIITCNDLTFLKHLNEYSSFKSLKLKSN
tara:strand:- start:4290 stop:4565 length:276 start_codon:yes stop_codon:yes gene_type:complete